MTEQKELPPWVRTLRQTGQDLGIGSLQTKQIEDALIPLLTHAQPAEDERVKERDLMDAHLIIAFCTEDRPFSEKQQYIVNASRQTRSLPLVQPAASTPTRCVKCGHNDTVNGCCAAFVPICSDDYHGTRFCGCKCDFTSPAAASTEAQDELTN